MASGPPDHPGYLLVPFALDSTNPSQPLKAFEVLGYRIVPGTVFTVGTQTYVFMEYGYTNSQGGN
jgi:hypothetical protein